MRALICGKPSILIYRGHINEDIMIKERFTINELQEKIRSMGVDSIADVEFAILETSGQISVIQKPEKRNTKPEDFGIIPEYEGIAYDLVIDGVVMKQNLQLLNKDYEWLKREVEKFGYEPEDALIVTINAQNEIFSQKKMRGK